MVSMPVENSFQKDYFMDGMTKKEISLKYNVTLHAVDKMTSECLDKKRERYPDLAEMIRVKDFYHLALSKGWKAKEVAGFLGLKLKRLQHMNDKTRKLTKVHNRSESGTY